MGPEVEDHGSQPEVMGVEEKRRWCGVVAKGKGEGEGRERRREVVEWRREGEGLVLQTE